MVSFFTQSQPFFPQKASTSRHPLLQPRERRVPEPPWRNGLFFLLGTFGVGLFVCLFLFIKKALAFGYEKDSRTYSICYGLPKKQDVETWREKNLESWDPCVVERQEEINLVSAARKEDRRKATKSQKKECRTPAIPAIPARCHRVILEVRQETKACLKADERT